LATYLNWGIRNRRFRRRPVRLTTTPTHAMDTNIYTTYYNLRFWVRTAWYQQRHHTLGPNDSRPGGDTRTPNGIRWLKYGI
jgi:hypothetical protein